MKKLHSLFVWALALPAAACLATDVRAASVGAGGYTNDFTTRPAAIDWSTISIAGAVGDITTAAQLDAVVQGVAAASVATQLGADGTFPPAALGTATWCSTGFFVQTRPNGVGATLLMCSLVNTLGFNASSVTLSYDFAKVLPTAEEVDGQRAYYSMTGAAASWTLIPGLSTASPGRLTATLNIAWPAGSSLYILWADDNGSGTLDTAFQIDNFSAVATSMVETPVTITSQPQSRTVGELAPVSFTVGASGNPAPTYQWYRNNTLLAGATSATYAIPAALLSDSGAQFKVVAANIAGAVHYAVTSSNALLTVNADTTAPTLVRALGLPSGTVSVDFSEPVRADTANVAANYSITSAFGALTISNAELQANGTNAVLTTGPQILNVAYTLLVSDVRDVSAASNKITANNLATFSSISVSPADVGNPRLAGQVSPVNGGANITAGGTNISGLSDQFSFAYQQVSGDFDYKVRVASLSLADVWSKASLMARETLATNSTFASAVASPGLSGTFFQSRASTNTAVINSGSGSVNYPNTWLRVTRSGNAFTGYSGMDGSSWLKLGSVTIAMTNTIYLGMAVSAAVANGSAVPTATAQFRDFLTNTSTALATTAPEVEPPGPSSRRTPIAITEIMYNPSPNTNGNILEFIEIYNSNPYFEDIGGWRISGDIDYVFPANTQLRAGEYRVIARNPAHVMAAYGISGVWGAYSNALKKTGVVRLRNKEDAILLEVNYGDQPPWPVAADGAGHSMVLARPSYGEGYAQAWSQSDKVGGSPGAYDGAGSSPQRAVVINEIYAHSGSSEEDFVELYNHSNAEVDMSGCTLSDSPSVNRFVLPAGTRIAPRSFVVFSQTQLGFGLSSGGETLYLRSADGARVLDAVRFGPHALGVSSGRFPDGAREVYPLTTRTPAAPNAAILVQDVVINEIMYKPISGLSDDEYVELHNKGAGAIDIGGWKFVAGIDYTFATNTVLAAGSYLVVARNAARLMTNYPNLDSNNTCGNFKGSLRNSGDRVALARPEIGITTNGPTVLTNTFHVVMDEVTYGLGGQWGNWANEGGSSLELTNPRANHRLAYNWADSDDTSEAPWTTIQATGALDLGSGTANFFEILALGEGEYLVDDVEVLPASNVNSLSATNSNFENGQGAWLFRGTHIQSSIDNTGGYGNNGKCLHVRASARGDTIHNRCLVPITTLITSPTATATLRAKVRWLRGWPEILFRVHGNYMEATGPLLLPATLGTPGARNSQATSNAPPAIDAVAHAPVVPPAIQPVVVSARVQDPDGISSVLLRYRVDPSAFYNQLVMNDGGTNGDTVAGDGIYSATMPGQVSGALVAYYVQATDDAVVPATVTFPRRASPTTPECLVRFGDPITTSGFGTYRQWMTAYNFNIWNTRPGLSNERLPVTLVNGNFRAIQFAAVKWAGSPYHQFEGREPNTWGHYSFDIPPDDLFLGTANVNKIHAPGNGPYDDTNIQREQTCYWFARQLGLPWNYRRCVNMYFNGNRPGGANQLMEDTETPGSDVVSSRWPDDADGNLYKLQPWFEVNDGTTHASGLGFANISWCDLTRYTTPSNGVRIQKVARYRYNYLARAVNGSANDYADVFALKDAADTAAGAAHVANMMAQCDMEQWMRTFAVHHSVGDWDHFGSQNSQNMYGYKPTRDKWKLMIWDMNIVIGNSGSWGEGQNLFNASGGGVNMDKLYNAPPFRRMYLRALKELCNGPFLPANLSPVLDSKYAAYQASGVNPVAPANLKTWIANARNSILAAVAGESAAAFKITGTNNITSATNLITLTGEAPVETYSIRINGIEYPITWTSVKAWSIRIPIGVAATTLTVQGYDIHGNILSGFTANVTVTITGPVDDPVGNVVFNELLYQPGVPDASFVELFNRSTNTAFDISGWRVHGLDFEFARGTVVGPRQYLVVAKNFSAFNLAFGTGIAPIGEFGGNIDPDGETLSLIKPATTNSPEVLINRFRYEVQSPWASTAPGNSLQLIDPSQDNGRVSNWTVSPPDGLPTEPVPWVMVSRTGDILNGTNILIWLGSYGASCYVDDISLTDTNGDDIVINGGFETGDIAPWDLGTNYASSVIVDGVSHSGSRSLLLKGLVPGGQLLSSVTQLVGPRVVPNTNYTLTAWILLSTNPVTFTARTLPGNNLSKSMATIPAPPLFPPPSASPGQSNYFAGTLPAYDPLWLNELQSENIGGLRDNHNDTDPWIEIYNAGPTPIDLNGYYLSDSYASNNLTQWPFPAGASIAPGEFKILWADGQPDQTSGTNLHTSFRLPIGNGTVALSRLVGGQPQITDYLTYTNLRSGLSYGDFPDGQPFSRRVFQSATGGGANSSRDINVFINEWMAANFNFLADPSDGQYDDWFELYNAGDTTVDLGSYYLTDNLGQPTKFHIPHDGHYVIPPGGYLLVWADNDSSVNSTNVMDLHASFALTADPGEAIGLYAPDGVTAIDTVTFGPQTNNVSEGRYADGATNRYYMITPTPRGANIIPSGNTPPVLNRIADRTVRLGQTVSFTATASDAEPWQTLTFSLAGRVPSGAFMNAAGQFHWTPNPAKLPSTNGITVVVTDSGAGALSSSGRFTVTVLPRPVAMISGHGGTSVAVSFDTIPGRSYQLYTKARISDATWQPLGTPELATGATLTISDNIGANPQRFYQILQLD